MVTNRASQKGAMAVFFAIGLVVLIGIGALAIDIGYGLVVKSELQNVSDTGTLAGTRELALIYDGLTDTCTSGSGDCYWGTHALTSSERSRIETKINSFTQANKAGGVAITVPSSDVLYGKYTGGTIFAQRTNSSWAVCRRRAGSARMPRISSSPSSPR